MREEGTIEDGMAAREERPLTDDEQAIARDALPDVRDGLTRVERIVLHQLSVLERERGGRRVPSALLYGRVCEHVNITPEAMQAVLARLGARKP